MEYSIMLDRIIKDLGKITVVAGDNSKYRLNSDDSGRRLDKYLTTFNKESLKAKESKSIVDCIATLKLLVFYFEDLITASRIEAYSYTDEKGKYHLVNIVRCPFLDQWVKDKIIEPTKIKIDKLEKLQAIAPHDLLVTKDSPNQEITTENYNSKADLDTPPPAITGIPVFVPDIIEPVYSILKAHFAPEQHTQLNELLTTGSTAGRLHFRSTGNRLADTFKQLIKANLITNCTQRKLETWIAQYFTYINNKDKKVNDFTLKYLNDIISTDKDKCQKPLLNVKIDNSTGNVKIIRA
jgi:hypothetical protein